MDSISFNMQDESSITSTLPAGSVIGAFSLDSELINQYTADAKATMNAITDTTSSINPLQAAKTLSSISDKELSEPPYAEWTKRPNLEVEEVDSAEDDTNDLSFDSAEDTAGVVHFKDFLSH